MSKNETKVAEVETTIVAEVAAEVAPTKVATDRANAGSKLAAAALAALDAIETEIRGTATMYLAAGAGQVAQQVRLGNAVMEGSAQYWTCVSMGQTSNPLPVEKNAKGEPKQPTAGAKRRAYVETRLVGADSQASAALYLDCIRAAQKLTVLYADFADAAPALRRVGHKDGIAALMALASSRGKIWGKSDSIRAAISPILARADSVPGKVLRAQLVDAGAIAPAKPGKSLGQRILDMETPDLAAILAQHPALCSLIGQLPRAKVEQYVADSPETMRAATAIVAKRVAEAEARIERDAIQTAAQAKRAAA